MFLLHTTDFKQTIAKNKNRSLLTPWRFHFGRFTETEIVFGTRLPADADDGTAYTFLNRLFPFYFGP